MTTPTPELMPEIVYLYSNGNVTEYMVHYEQHSPHKDWTKYVRADKYEKVLEDYHTLSRIKSTPPDQSVTVQEVVDRITPTMLKKYVLSEHVYLAVSEGIAQVFPNGIRITKGG